MTTDSLKGTHLELAQTEMLFTIPVEDLQGWIVSSLRSAAVATDAKPVVAVAIIAVASAVFLILASIAVPYYLLSFH